jgi:hypothetical protein
MAQELGHPLHSKGGDDGVAGLGDLKALEAIFSPSAFAHGKDGRADGSGDVVVGETPL